MSTFSETKFQPGSRVITVLELGDSGADSGADSGDKSGADSGDKSEGGEGGGESDGGGVGEGGGSGAGVGECGSGDGISEGGGGGGSSACGGEGGARAHAHSTDAPDDGHPAWEFMPYRQHDAAPPPQHPVYDEPEQSVEAPK